MDSQSSHESKNSIAMPYVTADGAPDMQAQSDPLKSQEDCSSDSDQGSDFAESNGLDGADDVVENEDAVGVSIGHRQSYMKDPQTPAFEKAKVLQNANEYFTAAETEETEEQSTPIDSPGPPQTMVQWPVVEEKANVLTSDHSTPSKPSGIRQGRSVASRTILGDGLQSLKRRASSPSAAIVESLRKLIPDVSSIFNSKPSTTANSLAGTRPGTAEKRNGFETERLRLTRSPSDTALDHFGDKAGKLPSIETSRPKNLRRSTSESSLYLRRPTTGISSYDSLDAYAEVSGQINSRFKAITDSLQDSNFKLNKLPNVHIPKMMASISGWSDGAFAGRDARHTDLRTAAQSSKEMSSASLSESTPASGGHTAASHRAHPIISEALSKMTGDVVVLGGYRGSILRSAEAPHRQLWVPVKVGLNLRKVDLEVGLTREDEETASEKIIPSGTLSHIGPIDICRRLLKHMKKSPNARSGELRVHDYGYDWRLSPDLLSDRLIKFLERLECNGLATPLANRGAVVVAHSLGGLITRHAINQRPDLFGGVVYAGVPQHCVNILGPLRNGDDVLLSSRVLTAQVNFTLRTSFALLPETGRCFIDKHTGERYDVDFFDAKTWDENRLSPCISPPLPAIQQEPRRSIVGSLADSITSSFSTPTKRGPWFTGRPMTPPSGCSTKKQDIGEVASDVADNATGVVSDVADAVASPTAKAEQSMGPSMASSSQKTRSASHSVATACTIPRDEAYAYLERTLASILAFKQQTAFVPNHQYKNLYPPIAFMFGKTVPTVYGARVASRDAIKHSDAYDDLAFAAGDGVVLASAAQLPPGYRCVRGGRIVTERGHVGILGDLEGVGKALNAIIDARVKGVGLGNGSLRPSRQ